MSAKGGMKYAGLGLLALFIMALAGSLCAQESIFGRPIEWYVNGPQLNWSDRDYDDYYRWKWDTFHSMARKTAGDEQLVRRQKTIMNGNKITTEIWNYGSISSPGNRTTDIIWEKLGYGYEFGPFIVAEVDVPKGGHRDVYMQVDEFGNPITNAEGDTLYATRIISDALQSYSEISPDGKDFWGFDPLAWNDDFTVPFADGNSERMPNSNAIDQNGDGRPDGWPAGWYNVNLKQYVWPGALRQGATNADLEVFCVVDDRNNREFEYYPFIDDSTRRGLGVEMECRYYQWANPLAEDIIFLVYKVTNKSDKDLDNVTFGMWGDPHIGGWNNYIDDLSYFDDQINMVYAWDDDGISDVAGRTPGYFGYKFLESPGNQHDGIDNDGDGMTDESRENGIDDDNDWDMEKHDVGIDGLPNTGDEGEDDGLPTAGDPFDIRKPGEPNFEWTDLDESDMIGLTSFAAPSFGQNNTIANDKFIYESYLTPGHFDSLNADVPGDNIFLYGSGNFTLKAGESQRFSIALLVGQDFDDLTLNAVTAQDIYESNYQFAKPPAKPLVTAVPGDRRVTLYWDDVAESSFDPISETYDFEGYTIYRSTDPQFLDQQTITDANGSKFLFKPLTTVNGAAAKFDLVNDYVGLSNIPYTGRGAYYNLGNNTGLVHSFIDSNKVVNGQIYYYAVVSYDHGDDDLDIAPTECSKSITLNPETNEIFLDVNTVRIIPRNPAAGFQAGEIANGGEIEHIDGYATASLWLEMLDPREIEENNLFEITFRDSPTSYTIEDKKIVTENNEVNFNIYFPLAHRPINPATFNFYNSTGDTMRSGIDYLFLPTVGQVVIPDSLPTTLLPGENYSVEYTYYPVYRSQALSSQETNPVFDGMKIYAQDVPLQIDNSRTGWTSGSQTTYLPSVGDHNYQGTIYKFNRDFEIRFSDSISDTGLLGATTNFVVYDVTNGKIPEKQEFGVFDNSPADGTWTPGEKVVVMKADDNGAYSLPTGKFNPLGEFTFLPPSDTVVVIPSDGDVYFIGTRRPFTAMDVYRFTSTASKIVRSDARNDLDRIRVIPNPYVVTNQLEQLDLQKTRDRGPRRIYFDLLPTQCTIRIYTISGELVDVLEHNSPIDDGKEFWDLTTRDNFPIAFGQYLYHVDAGSLGETIGRFAVIK